MEEKIEQIKGRFFAFKEASKNPAVDFYTSLEQAKTLVNQDIPVLFDYIKQLEKELGK